jgi:hypothetical protein
MHSLRTPGVLFTLLVSLASWSQAAPQSGSQTSTTSPDAIVHLLMTVSDATGNPVPAPAKDSVQLRIGGHIAEVEGIRSLKNTPLVFSLLVDVSGSTRPFVDQQISASSELFRALSSAGNHGYLILFKSKVVTVDRFLDAGTVQETLRKFTPSSRTGGTALYDAMVRAITQLTSVKTSETSRRGIFIFSDGDDNSSHSGFKATLRLAQNANIPVFSMAFSKNEAFLPTPEERDGWRAFERLSRSTGGTVGLLDEPGDVAMRIARLVDGQCVLSFKPPALKPGKSYRLKIESSDHEIRLFAPSDYSLP